MLASFDNMEGKKQEADWVMQFRGFIDREAIRRRVLIFISRRGKREEGRAGQQTKERKLDAKERSQSSPPDHRKAPPSKCRNGLRMRFGLHFLSCADLPYVLEAHLLKKLLSQN